MSVDVVVAGHYSSLGQLFSVSGPSKKEWNPFLQNLGYAPLVLDTNSARNAMSQGNVGVLLFEFEPKLFERNENSALEGIATLSSLAKLAQRNCIPVIALVDETVRKSPLSMRVLAQDALYVVERPAIGGELSTPIQMCLELKVDAKCKPVIRAINFKSEFLQHLRAEAKSYLQRSTFGIEADTEIKLKDFSFLYHRLNIYHKDQDEWIDFTPYSRNYLSGLCLMLHDWRKKLDTPKNRTFYTLEVKK